MRAGRKEWPYVSTIVWPIRKRLAKAPETDERLGCLGFLCVDTKGRRSFRERFDTWLGASYADAVYEVMQALRVADQEPMEVGGAKRDPA